MVPKSGEARVIGPLSRTDRFSNQSAMEERLRCYPSIQVLIPVFYIKRGVCVPPNVQVCKIVCVLLKVLPARISRATF